VVSSPTAQAHSTRVRDHLVGSLDELHERVVPWRERKDVLPEALVIAEVPIELGLVEAAHAPRHLHGIGKFAYCLRREEDLRCQVAVGLEVQTEEQEQGYRETVRGIHRDNRQSYRGILCPGDPVWHWWGVARAI